MRRRRLERKAGAGPGRKVILIAAVALAVAGGVVWYLLQPPALSEKLRLKQERLLKHTDHVALRQACHAFLLKYGRRPRVIFSVDDTRIPPIVARLEPTEVTLGETFVRVELGEGSFHFGVEVFRDRMAQAPYPTGEEISPGLWYYETNRPVERTPP